MRTRSCHPLGRMAFLELSTVVFALTVCVLIYLAWILVFQPSAGTNEHKELIFRYTAPGGGIAQVPRVVWPYKVLNVDLNASSDDDIKEAFRRVASSNRRQTRVMASLSYNILKSKIHRYRKRRDKSYEVVQRSDVFVLAVVGATATLLSHLSKDKFLLTHTDEHDHTLLYLTARSGFYDTTEALLKLGIPVNKWQVDGSTPLHAASYYGQRLIVELLLRYGADPIITNRWGCTPADEAYTDEIKQVIMSYKEDHVSRFVISQIQKGLASRIRLVEREGSVIGKEVLRNPRAFDPATRRTLDSIASNWVTAWHGTKFQHLESILHYGLKPTGSMLPDGTVVKSPWDHFGLGETHFGVYNWANAIFLSPSIAYASHACYSERIFSLNEQWCVLVKALVEPSAYTMHEPSTIFKYDPVDGEPESPEFRIEAEPGDTIFRVEYDRNVVVISVVFISLNFLENTPNLTFTELKSLFDTKYYKNYNLQC